MIDATAVKQMSDRQIIANLPPKERHKILECEKYIDNLLLKTPFKEWGTHGGSRFLRFDLGPLLGRGKRAKVLAMLVSQLYRTGGYEQDELSFGVKRINLALAIKYY